MKYILFQNSDLHNYQYGNNNAYLDSTAFEVNVKESY